MVQVPVTQRRHHRTPRAVRALVGLAHVLVLVAAVGVVCAHLTVGLGVQTVLSDSMRPAFAAGDHLVVVDRHPGSLQVGDVPVLMFSDGSLRAHRIVAVEPGPDVVRLLTRGDANPTDDTWTEVAAARDLPVGVSALPALPTVVDEALHTVRANPLPSALVLGLGGFALTCWAMRRQYLVMRSCPCRECQDRQDRRSARSATQTQTQTQRLGDVEQHQTQETR